MTGPRLVLVGPPGAGKTTVGRLLAQELDLEFRDTDQDIEASQGASIADLFVYEGEKRFRELEQEAVNLALREFDGVLSLGGGAILSEATRDLLRGHEVLFLSAGVGAAVKRVGMARDRPVLALNPRASLHVLLEQRLPLYREVATWEIVTDDLAPDDVVREVLRQI
ncbi:MAG: Shikimate kinase [Frankiales bacterium]|nr:Shikimate kinase [Frankiales bacterium]